jgi:hypothetical protein
MKLAVLADSKGQILGLAVCRVTFSSEPNNPREVSIRAEPLQKHSSEVASFKTHVVDLPSHLANKSHDELNKALHDIHASMSLDLTQSVPSLRERAELSVPSLYASP